MRALGLDVGEKTIGVAISDELGLAAHPVTTLPRRSAAADARAVIELAAERGVTDLVVGMPLALDGREGRAARRVRALLRELEAEGGELRIHEWDERFSTVAAERVLLEADLSRRRRKQVVDKQAAAFILQGWLDAGRDR